MLFAAAIILLTSYIILQTCLLKQVIIQFDYTVAKSEAFGLDGFANFAHDKRWLMAEV